MDSSAFQTGLQAQVAYAQAQGSLISQALTFAPKIDASATTAATAGFQTLAAAELQVADGAVDVVTAQAAVQQALSSTADVGAMFYAALHQAGVGNGEIASSAPSAATGLGSVATAAETAAKAMADLNADDPSVIAGITGIGTAAGVSAGQLAALVGATDAYLGANEALVGVQGTSTAAMEASAAADQAVIQANLLLAEAEKTVAQGADLAAAATRNYTTSLEGEDAAILVATANLNANADANLRVAQAETETASASAGLGASGFGLLAIGAGLVTVKLIEMGAGFDAQMSKMEGFAGVAHSEMAGLSGDVLNLSTATGASAKNIAEGLYFARSAGLSTADALTVLERSTRLANAAQIESKPVVDVTTSAMNAYGESAGSLAHIQDVLTATTVAGKLEFGDLAGSLGKVLPIAAAMHIPLEQVGASIAQMTEKGIPAQSAVQTLQAIISGLEKPTKAAQAEMTALGTSADEVRQSIRDRGLLATLSDLQARTGGNVTAMEQLFPNFRALRGVLADTGQSTQDYVRILQSENDAYGRSQAAIDAYQQTSQYKIHQFTAAVEADLIRAGAAVAGFAATWVVAGQTIADALATLEGPLQRVKDAWDLLPGPVRSAVEDYTKFVLLTNPLTGGIEAVKLVTDQLSDAQKGGSQADKERMASLDGVTSAFDGSWEGETRAADAATVSATAAHDAARADAARASAMKQLTSDQDAAARSAQGYAEKLSAMAETGTTGLTRLGTSAQVTYHDMQADSEAWVAAAAGANERLAADDAALAVTMSDDSRKVLETKRQDDADAVASATTGANLRIEAEHRYLQSALAAERDLEAIARQLVAEKKHAGDQIYALDKEIHADEVKEAHLSVTEQAVGLGSLVEAHRITAVAIQSLYQQLYNNLSAIGRAFVAGAILVAEQQLRNLAEGVSDATRTASYDTKALSADTAALNRETAATIATIGGEATAVRDLTSSQDAKNTLDTVGLNLQKQVKDTSEVVTASQLAGLHDVTEAKRGQATADLAEAETARQAWQAAAQGYDPLTKLGRAYSAEQIAQAESVYKQKKSLLDADVKDFDAVLTAQGKAQSLFDSQQQASALASIQLSKDRSGFLLEEGKNWTELASTAARSAAGWGAAGAEAAETTRRAWLAADAQVLADDVALTGDMSAEDRKRLEDTRKTDEGIATSAHVAATAAANEWKAEAAAEAQANSDTRKAVSDTRTLMLDLVDVASNAFTGAASGMAASAQAGYAAWKTANDAVLADDEALKGQLTETQRAILTAQRQTDVDRRDSSGELLRAQIQDARDYESAVKSALSSILQDETSVFDLTHHLSHLTTAERVAGVGQWLAAEINVTTQIIALQHLLTTETGAEDRKRTQGQIDNLNLLLGQYRLMEHEASVAAQDLTAAWQAAAQGASQGGSAFAGFGVTATTAMHTTAAAVKSVIDPLKELQAQATAAFNVIQTAASDASQAVSDLQAQFQAPTIEESGVTQQLDAINVQLDTLAVQGVASTDASVVALESQKKVLEGQLKLYQDQKKAITDHIAAETDQRTGVSQTIATLAGESEQLVNLKVHQVELTNELRQAKTAQDSYKAAQDAATAGAKGLGSALETVIADYQKLAAAALVAAAAVSATGSAASGGTAAGTLGGGTSTSGGSQTFSGGGAPILGSGTNTGGIAGLSSYQHGGIVPTDQIAQVHAGEWVLPKELVGQPQQGPQLPPALVAALREPRPSTSTSTVGPFNVTINVQGGGTPQETARAVRQEIAAWERDVFGRNAMLGATRG